MSHAPIFRLVSALLIPFFIFNFHPAFAQISNHGLVWYFGFGGGLDFSVSPPAQLTNINVDSYEGVANYCDANGNMLLYTNGGGTLDNGINGPRTGFIWNRDQQPLYTMPLYEGGGYSSAQGAIILPDPGNTNRYYVFVVDDFGMHSPLDTNRGLSYYTVDMTLNAGLGGVTGGNVPVHKPAVEAITAVPMASGNGFWVIIIDADTKDWVVTPVTAAGVGQPFVQDRPQGTNAMVIKASPDGKWLCTNGNLYTFDAATGTIVWKEVVGTFTYSFTFSPNSRYLYAYATDLGLDPIVRFDLTAQNIGNSAINLPFPIVDSFHGLMQIGPDGNIYICEQLLEDFEDFTVSVSVIRCPDRENPTLEPRKYVYNSDPNTNSGLFTSLPNFADYIFASTSSITSDTVEVFACFPGDTVLTAPLGESYLWTPSGSTDSFFVVNDPGFYTVATLRDCKESRRTFHVMASSGPPTMDSTDVFRCSGATVSLQPAVMGSQYLWSTGETANTISVGSAGVYFVDIQLQCGVSRSYFFVEDLPVIQNTDSAYVYFCPDQFAVLDAGLPGAYLWDNGDTASIIIVEELGTYFVDITQGCSFTRRYFFVENNVLVIAPDTVVVDLCDGPVVLNAGEPALSYLWSNGSDTSSITVSIPGWYSVEVENECVMQITFFEVLGNSFTGPDSDTVRLEICPGDTLKIEVAIPGEGYQWNTGSTDQSILVQEEGRYSVEVERFCGNTETVFFVQYDTACCKPEVPTAFSPNGDNINEKFAPLFPGCRVTFVEFSVYSRWGSLIFQSIYGDEEWDGTVNGSPAPADVYIYQMRYQFEDGSEAVGAGEVTLLR